LSIQRSKKQTNKKQSVLQALTVKGYTTCLYIAYLNPSRALRVTCIL